MDRQNASRCCGTLSLCFVSLLAVTHCARGARANRNGGQDDEGLSLESDVHDEQKSRPQLLAHHNHSANITLVKHSLGHGHALDPFMLPHANSVDAEGWDGRLVVQGDTQRAWAQGGDVNVGASPYMRLVTETSEQQRRSRSLNGVLRDMLMNLGGGTGATVGGTGDVSLDQDLLRRMRFQDKAVMLLLLLAYTGSLAFSASLVYRQAGNDSPILYYADPRFHNIAVDEDDIEGFLEAFNQPPKETHLQVTGLLPLPNLPESFLDHGVDWMGSRYRVAFSFALDLSPWIVRCEVPTDEGQGQGAIAQSEAADGIRAGDLQRLADFLAYNRNDLAVLELKKEVDWNDWEELAMNIKHHIRQTGFRGVTTVTRSGAEIVTVHKNRPWANFMHSRTTKVLCALSIFGWMIYQPYMILRNSSTAIRSRFKVDVDIRNYWSLISDKIGSEGFDINGAQPFA